MLCEECRDELSSPIHISPEQIQCRVQRPTTSALVDLWGRIHPLEARTLIGRQIEAQGLAVLEPSVSRHHAHLTLDGATWRVRDLGSANGTYLDDKLVEHPATAKTGDRIRFGQIAFYLIEDVANLPIPRLTRTVTTTIKPPNGRAPSTSEDDDDAFGEDRDRTDIGLPQMRFRMHEPTGGGGGLIEVDGKQVQLTTTQFELMALMIKRMAEERHQPELVRGFVRSSELIADLSWDTREPSENHVKQLVRRVRRALLKAEIGDLIESRHRFGYRLRAIPRPE